VTGPCAEIGFMGYADPSQKGNGIHTRLHSRAFVVEDASGARVVFVSVDAGMTGQLVRTAVLEKLKLKFGDVYHKDNVAISSTHTHSGPGGYLQYALFEVTLMGFVKESFWTLVDGIFNSIVEAHENLHPADIHMMQGHLKGANINRSPYAYAFNPQDERAQYTTDTDTTMTLLKASATVRQTMKRNNITN
jgi:neutral ceramidase